MPFSIFFPYKPRTDFVFKCSNRNRPEPGRFEKKNYPSPVRFQKKVGLVPGYFEKTIPSPARLKNKSPELGPFEKDSPEPSPKNIWKLALLIPSDPQGPIRTSVYCDMAKYQN